MSVLKSKAVILRGVGEYGVEEVTVDPPKAGEVRVKMAATGVCGSDLSAINANLAVIYPLVLGHEGAGVVESVGEGVTHLEPGDHVALSFVPFCGTCYVCEHQQPNLCRVGRSAPGTMLDGTIRIHKGDEDIFTLVQLGAMAEYIVAPVASVVKVDKAVPLDRAALVGCAIMTGVGAAINTAEVKPGSTVVVFGCGGVGLSIIQGAKIAGASKIIGVDLAENKLELAEKFGATDVINPEGKNIVKEIRKMTKGVGADYGFEAIGNSVVMGQAYNATREGGVFTAVGLGKPGTNLEINAYSLPLSGRTIKGSMYGSGNPPRDFPMLLDLYQVGKLNLDDMVTQRYSIDQVVDAFDDLKANANARGVIVFDEALK